MMTQGFAPWFRPGQGQPTDLRCGFLVIVENMSRSASPSISSTESQNPSPNSRGILWKPEDTRAPCWLLFDTRTRVEIKANRKNRSAASLDPKQNKTKQVELTRRKIQT